MKTITLDSLFIRNFKGCRELELQFGGHSAAIYGDNAAGKTTVYDALTWLLFGKDSTGASKFNIKPLNERGEVLDHAAETDVKAVLLVDEEPVTLERTYFELWSKKRGSSEATFDGHSSSFFYNGLPVQKGEFSDRVGQLCDEATFRTLTDLRWFCAGESEANRRAALFELAGGVTEADVLAADPAFLPLTEALRGLTVAEFQTAAQKQRRTLNTKAKTTPARIDEQKRVISEYDAVDFSALREQRERAKTALEKAQSALHALRGESGTDILRAQLDGLRAQLDALEEKNELHRARQKDTRREQSLRTELDRAKSALRRLRQDVPLAEREISLTEERITRCREDWKRYNAQFRDAEGEQFTPGRCPTCGQALPSAMAIEQQYKWEREHNAHITELKARRDETAVDAKELKDREEALKTRLAQQRTELEETQVRQTELEAELQKLTAQTAEDLPDYMERRAELTRAIAELETQLEKAAKDCGAALSAARGEVKAKTQNLERLDGLLAGEAVLSRARERVQELLDTQRATAAETERIDSLLELCDRFTRAKADCIDREVNGRFRLVRWKLFEEQINGGLKDCCKATVNGVPYADLNSGMKINAGLDVIAALSAAKDVRVPLFIDNAESVTRLAGADTQTIRLVVSGKDKTLRTEMED